MKAAGRVSSRSMEKTMQKLRNFLKKQDFVSVAYIFGSVAEDRQGPLSDIDIAVLLNKKLNKRERSRKKLFLIGEISSILKTDNFDLVVMNDAPMLLKYNIIKTGRILKPGRERVAMEARLISEYLDRKFYDDMYARLSLERMSKEGIA